MSTISNVLQETQGQALSGGFWAGLRRWWISYLEWRVERLAAAQLYGMSDRELKDIGLNRSEIQAALKGDSGRNRLHVHYY